MKVVVQGHKDFVRHFGSLGVCRLSPQMLITLLSFISTIILECVARFSLPAAGTNESAGEGSRPPQFFSCPELYFSTYKLSVKAPNSISN